MRSKTAVAILTAACCARPLAAQDWPQWRGPARDGVAASFQPPMPWPKALKLQWKTPVGSGHSSPVVAGGRAFVHTRQDEQEVAAADHAGVFLAGSWLLALTSGDELIVASKNPQGFEPAARYKVAPPGRIPS